MTPLAEALVITVLFALVILATRAFPFVLFSRKDPPRAIRFVERFMKESLRPVRTLFQCSYSWLQMSVEQLWGGAELVY